MHAVEVHEVAEWERSEDWIDRSERKALKSATTAGLPSHSAMLIILDKGYIMKAT